MLLALDMTLTPERVGLVILLLTTIERGVAAYLNKKGYVRESAALDAVIQGVEVGVQQVASGGAYSAAVGETVQMLATEAGVNHDVVGTLVKGAQQLSAGTGPAIKQTIQKLAANAGVDAYLDTRVQQVVAKIAPTPQAAKVAA